MPDQVAKWLTGFGGKGEYRSEIVGRSGDSIQVYLKPGSFTPQYGLGPGETFLGKIKAGRYDLVVLQVVTNFLMNEGGPELERALDTYCAAIREAGGEPVFYEMGWGLEPLNDEGRERVFRAAVRNRVRYVAPCSTAWKRVRAERPDLELHNLPDRSHPGTLGNYLNQCILFATISGRKPDRIPLTLPTWIRMTDEAKAEAAVKVAEVRDPDPYFKQLPDFLKRHTVMARPHTFDGETARYFKKVAQECTAAMNRRLKKAT